MDNTITPTAHEFNIKDAISFYKKMNAIRKELCERGILPKGAHNDYDNYDYFSEAQYKELFTEFFSKHGIEIFFDEVDRGSFDGTEKQPFGRYVTLACILIDSETGFTLITHHTGEGLDRGDKAIYKATTGAIKKFLSSTFLVATKDDPEREDEKKPSKKITSTSWQQFFAGWCRTVSLRTGTGTGRLARYRQCLYRRLLYRQALRQPAHGQGQL